MEKVPIPNGENEEGKNRIVNRIEKEANIPNLLETLVSIPSSNLQSLLLEITEKRAENVTPKEINIAL